MHRTRLCLLGPLCLPTTAALDVGTGSSLLTIEAHSARASRYICRTPGNNEAQKNPEFWHVHMPWPGNSAKKTPAGLVARDYQAAASTGSVPDAALRGFHKPIGLGFWIPGLAFSRGPAFSERPCRHYLIPLTWLPSAKIDH